MLTGVVAFLLFLIVLLAIPLTLTFQVSWKHFFQNEIELQWAFGLVHFRVPPFKPKAPSSEDEEMQQKVGRWKRSSSGKRNFFAVIRHKAFRRRIFRFIDNLWHAVHKKNLSLRVRVGLGDPADTGRLWGILGPTVGLLANVREASIAIEPEFLDTTFELDSSGSVRIIPLQMVYLTMLLLLSPSIWHGIRQIRMAEQ